MEQREVELGSGFPACGDASPVVQPGVGALDRPAVAGVGVAAFSSAATAADDDPCTGFGSLAAFAAATDHGLNQPFAKLGAETFAVVAPVGP